jgi:hypothetical protein
VLQQFLNALLLWKSFSLFSPLVHWIHKVFPRSTCEMSRLSLHRRGYLRAANSGDGLTMTTPFMPLASCRVHTYR